MKRLDVRCLLAMLLLVVVTQGVAASGGSGESTTGAKETITFMTLDAVNFRGMLETFIEEFQAKNPNITVEAEFSPTLWAEVPAVMQAGTEPDIIFMWSSGLMDYIRQGKIAALSQGFSAHVQSRLFDYSLKPAMKDGKLFAVPYNYYPSFGTVMYNKQIFAKAGIQPPTKAPATWDDLMKLAQKLTVKDQTGTIVQAGFSARDRADAYWFSWVLQRGGKIFNEDGTAAFDTDIGRDAVRRYAEIYTLWKVDSPEFGSPLDEFKKGTVAMTLGMPWLASILEKDAPDLEFGFFPMPTLDGAKPLWAFYELWMFVGTTRAADKPAVWKFLEYLLEPEQAARFSAFSGEISSVRKAVDAPEVTGSAILKPFLPLMPYGVDSNFHTGQTGDVEALLRSTMPESVIFGKATVEEALRSAAQEVNRLNAPR